MRPKLPIDQRRDEVLHFRILPAVKVELQRLAADDGRPLGMYIQRVLQEHVAAATKRKK